MVAVPPTFGFPGVAGLAPHGGEAARKLQIVYQMLLDGGARSDAERLLGIDKLAARGDFPMLERAAMAGQRLDELAEIQHAGARRIGGIRNAVAIIPLMVTWLALAWASWQYHHELQVHPELSTEPFLVLWQRRFDGAIIPTFAETAVFSFVLLFAVLLLTVFAQRLESAAARDYTRISIEVDDAMGALALAAETSSVRPPITAAEWAEAAQRVLTETQAMISAAVTETDALARANQDIAKTSAQAVTRLKTETEVLIQGLTQSVEAAVVRLRDETEDLIGRLAEGTRALMIAIQDGSTQAVERAAESAKVMLLEAGSANKELIEQHMTPLFEGFRGSLDDYRADQEVYRDSATTLSGGVRDLSDAAKVLSDSSSSYTDVARSIDEQLRLMSTSQSDFVEKITENSQSMTTAATAMRDVTGLMTGRMRADLEQLTRNVIDASSQMVSVDRDLASTSAALSSTTRAMETSASSLAGAARSAEEAATAARTAATIAGSAATAASSAASSASSAASSASSAATVAASVGGAGPRRGFWARLFGGSS